MSQESKFISAYSLYDFTLKIAEAVREGYGLTDTNEGMPQSMGPGYYSCVVVKEVQVDLIEEAKVDEAQEEEKPATQTSSQPTKTARSKKSTTK